MDIGGKIRDEYLTLGLEEVWKHVAEVADISGDIALRFGLDPVRVRISALLHDISAVMSDDEMYELAKSRGLELDTSEVRYHFLLHQRISALIAHERYGVSDLEILSAIECHTTLKKKATAFDKALFISDKLSTSRSGRPPYYNLVRNSAETSLDSACYLYIRYLLDHGLLSMPHTWLTEAFSELSEMCSAELFEMEKIL